MLNKIIQNNLLRRKITFTSEEERRAAATKIKTEAMQCKSFFKDVAGDMADFDSPFDTLATLAGVLSSDEEMVCKHIPSPKCYTFPLSGQSGAGDTMQKVSRRHP